MKQNIIHIVLDVDDNQYHGSALNKAIGEVFEHIQALLRQNGRYYKSET